MPQPQSSGGRWYPNANYFQAMKPEDMVKVFKQVLDQHYALVDKFENYRRENSLKEAKKERYPAGSGPTDTMLLGLRVAPVDTASLADGTKLTFVKSSGNFQFK